MNYKTFFLKKKNEKEKRRSVPRYFMILRKEDITVEIGFNSTVALPLFSAFTIDLNASFNILLPISLSRTSSRAERLNTQNNTAKTSADENVLSFQSLVWQFRNSNNH